MSRAVKTRWYHLVGGLLILSSGACSGSPDERSRPDEAVLVALLLGEYHEEYRGYRSSEDEPMLVDPSIMISMGAGALAAPPAFERLISDAAERLGLGIGDWERAQKCGSYVASLSVPEVIERGDPPPEGCEPKTGAVFAFTIDQALDSLRLLGSGMSRDWAHSFTAIISKDGTGLRVVESVTGSNSW